MKRLVRLLAVALACAMALPANAAVRPLRLMVFGGTGSIGQRIVIEALGRGHLVVAVARNPDRVEVAGAGLAVTRGDVLDTAAVTRLVGGQDVVISAVSARGADRDDPDYLKRVAESLVGALRSLGTRAPRLIVVGGAGTLEVAPGVTLIDQALQSGSLRAGPALQQKAALDYLRGVHDVDWTYFSPPLEIAPGPRTGKFRLGGDQLLRDASGASRISIDDYALAVVDEAEHAAHSHQRFTIAY